MEYSIRKLSRLSGVTTRTLRWYDEIGLPCIGALPRSIQKTSDSPPITIDPSPDALHFCGTQWRFG